MKMFEAFADLVSSYGFGVVFLIFIVVSACIIKIITFCKDLWAKRQKFIDANIEKGKKIEAAEEAETLQHTSQDTKIKNLEGNINLLTDAVNELKKQNELLLKSDMLATKAWIKEQHDIWVPKQCIDSQILDLLEAKYKIYKQEKGNSWAERLMEDLRALPLITVIPVDKDKE